MAKKKEKTLTDQVRQAIEDCGESRYRISQNTGIDQAVLSKFFNRHQGLYSDTLDVLCKYLDLEIVTRRKPKSKGK